MSCYFKYIYITLDDTTARVVASRYQWITASAMRSRGKYLVLVQYVQVPSNIPEEKLIEQYYRLFG